MTPKIIFVDWYITLSRSLYWEYLRDSDTRTFEVLSQWLVNSPDVFSGWMRGRLTARQLARRASGETDIDDEYIYTTLMKSCELLTYDTPAILDEIDRLRSRGVVVVIATDNIAEFSTVTVPAQRLLDHFDAVLNSAELGCLKGDGVNEGHIPFFDKFIAQHGMYDDAILIDDADTFVSRYQDTPLRQIRVSDASETHEVLRRLASR